MTLMDAPPTTSMVSLTVDGARANLTLSRQQIQRHERRDDSGTYSPAGMDSGAKCRPTRRPRGQRRSSLLANPCPSRRRKHFCAGADINMMRDAGANTPEENRADSERLDDCSTASGLTLVSPSALFKGLRLEVELASFLAATMWWPQRTFASHSPKENWAFCPP